MKLRYLYMFFCCYIITSCSNFLNIEPDEQVSINEQLSTKTGVLEAYNGIYFDLENVYASNYILYADALGGNITFIPFGDDNDLIIPAYITSAYNFDENERDLSFDDYYDLLYGIVNQTNLLLENSTNFPFFSSEEINQLKAELLTIRALAHYQVSLLFAQNYNFTNDASHLGVVYNLQTLTAGVDFPSRKTMAETYNLIENDLDEALSLYQDIQIQNGVVTSYFSKISTEALYARIALQMNDWEKAIEFSNNVIQNSGISLMSKENYIQQWELPEAPVSETIFEFSAPRTSEGDISSSISIYFRIASSSDQTTFARQVASGDLLELYTATDIRGNLFLIENLATNENGIEILKDYYFTKKFQDNPGTLLMRLSELYLIRAEANTRLSNIDEALSDLNTIRNRAGLTTINSTSNILEEIFLERTRELAFEGHLLFDIIRYKKDVVRNLGCLSTTCNLSYPSNFFILPLPFSSTSLNQNIEQNAGY